MILNHKDAVEFLVGNAAEIGFNRYTILNLHAILANNLLADQAWHVLRRRGLRLPDDVSLVGFDDVPWMEMVSPAITVVAPPTEELGRRAAELLLRRLDDPAREPRVEQLEPTLVVRGSTGPNFHG